MRLHPTPQDNLCLAVKTTSPLPLNKTWLARQNRERAGWGEGVLMASGQP